MDDCHFGYVTKLTKQETLHTVLQLQQYSLSIGSMTQECDFEAFYKSHNLEAL
jgi:hypothetical protein